MYKKVAKVTKNKQKRKKDKKKELNCEVRSLSYREMTLQAWRIKNPTRKLLFKAKETMGFEEDAIWYWYDDNTSLRQCFMVDHNGNTRIRYEEIVSPTIRWNDEDWGEKILPELEKAV